MTNKYRSVVSAIALLVLAPAPSAMAQLLDGDGIVGGVVDTVDGVVGGVTDPGAGNVGPVDVTVGGANAVVDGNVGLGSEPALGIGEPGDRIDLDVDGGNLANIDEENGLNIDLLQNNGDNDGATAIVDALGGTPTAINLNENGEIAGIHVDRDGDDVADIVIPRGAVDNILDNDAIDDLLGLDLPIVGGILDDGDPLPTDPNEGTPVPGGGAMAGITDPGLVDAIANISDMTPAQRRAVRAQCRDILANPGGFDSSLVALCAALR